MKIIDWQHCRAFAAWIGLVGLLLSGCNRLSDSYGRSSGKTGRESLNGFGALRSSFENAGYETRDITRLSERVSLTSTIVWTPQAVSPITPTVTRWFESWLRKGGKTLVYIVPDGGSSAQYWHDAGKLASPQQRLEYRRRAARELNKQLMWRLNRQAVSSNGWFMLEPLEHRATIADFSSSWATDRVGELSFSAEYELSFQSIDDVEVFNASLSGTNPPAGMTGPNGGWYGGEEAEPSEAEYDFQTLLSGDAMLVPREPLTSVAKAATKPASPPPATSPPRPLAQREVIVAARISNDDWQGSQVIVVNSGSLLTNYAFTREPNRQIAMRLVDASTQAGVDKKFAGFVTSSDSSIPVSENTPGVPKATGMEMLTVWPISLITMHGLLFGLIVCLMLFPIFGRPRHVRRIDESNFGDHLDAVALLMKKTGGETYARHRISEYMRRIRGEHHGPWVIEQESPSRIANMDKLPSSPGHQSENVN